MIKKHWGVIFFVLIASASILFVLSKNSPEKVSAYSAQTIEPRGAAALNALDRLPYLKRNTSVHLAASYDRSGGNADGAGTAFAQTPPPVGDTGNGFVVLDQRGAGTIYRIWMTAPQGGKIRIYFDGEATPRVNMPVVDFFDGNHAPFLKPLVGNDIVSSGGYYSYYPFSFTTGVRVEFTNVPNYYQITYHTYDASDSTPSYTGTENLDSVINQWNNPSIDPKDITGNQVATNSAFSLTPGQSKELLNVTGAGSVRSIVMNIPQLLATQYIGPTNTAVTDNGRAFTGNSTFTASVAATNSGVLLTRRLDFGIANQVADVYIQDASASYQLVGRWSNPGSDGTYNWRDSDFSIPASFTQGKTQINIKVQFVSSSNDWNEFYYWIKSLDSASNVISTDPLDVDDATSEASHNYVITGSTWEGTRTYNYPGGVPTGYSAATVDILKNTRIQLYWDNEASPSADVPLGFFFGLGSSGYGSVKGLLIGTDPANQNMLYNYFPMPYKTSARAVLVNNSSTTISSMSSTLSYNANEYQGLGSDAGYFKAMYKKEYPTTTNKDFVMVDLPSAKGQVVGFVVNINNFYNEGLLEGDDRVFIDQTDFTPQLHGTGTEDIFNGGFYFNKGIFTLPLQGNPLKHGMDGSGHIAMYRLNPYDTYPFEKKLLMKLEHAAVNDANADYESVVFAYVIPNSESLIQTDILDVGTASSELAHDYSIATQTAQGVFSGTFIGRDDGGSITHSSRAHKGTSIFTMAINPNNNGVRLGRIFDFTKQNQKATVSVFNTTTSSYDVTGTWYDTGLNAIHKASYSTFEIPSTLTAGKSSIQVKISIASTDPDWSEVEYIAYSHVYGSAVIPTDTPTPSPTLTPTPTDTPTPTPTNTPIPTSTPTLTPTPIPTYGITGKVYIDANSNGAQDSGEGGYQGGAIELTGDAIASRTTNSTGDYTIENLNSGNFTVALTVPSGYSATTTNPVIIGLSADTTVNFGIALVPTATPTPTPTPTNTPVPTATPTPTVTPTPNPFQTLTFDDLAVNTILSNQYSLTWPKNTFVISNAVGPFTTKNLGYKSGATNNILTVPSPKKFVSLQVYNSGTFAATITVRCDSDAQSNPQKTTQIGAGQSTTITTGWNTYCNKVKLTSTNLPNIRYDNFVLKIN